MDVKITILQVEVANLRPNPWNTNSVGAQNFEKLKGSIEKLGFFKPILARELDGGIFEILGGEHRWRAAMEQGISTVPVISVGKINDLVAKQMSLVDNERYGEDDQVALQRLIEEIQSEIDYRLSDIAPYDDEMAATLAKASVIDLEALEALSRGDGESVDEDKREKTERVGAEHQTMRFKVTFDASDHGRQARCHHYWPRSSRGGTSGWSGACAGHRSRRSERRRSEGEASGRQPPGQY